MCLPTDVVTVLLLSEKQSIQLLYLFLIVRKFHEILPFKSIDEKLSLWALKEGMMYSTNQIHV